MIETSLPGQRLETYRTMDGLARRLRRPFVDLIIAVLLASGKEDFLNILSLSDLLSDFRIILILPDRDRETISNALRLRPRFLTFSDGDFAEVAAVLHKMLKTYAEAPGAF